VIVKLEQQVECQPPKGRRDQEEGWLFLTGQGQKHPGHHSHHHHHRASSQRCNLDRD
jgi:hypothetical protein